MTPLSTREALRRIGAPGQLALIAAAVLVIAVTAQLPGLVSAILAPSAASLAPKEDPNLQRAQEFADATDQLRQRLDGRSLFFVPGPPPPPPPPIVVNDEPPPPPPKPAVYAGPTLVAMVNDSAWFSDGTVLTAGDPASGDLRVLAIRAPWEAVLEWKGVEFTVSLFEHDRHVMPEPPRPAPNSPETTTTENPAEEPKPPTEKGT